ncbi:MAG: acetylxylan esterase [Verrucomicrobia bacterium]|nr:acetylxylan esterase [Verrucomicrobiota bacterium]
MRACIFCNHQFFFLFAITAAGAVGASAAEDKEDLAVLARWPRYQQSPHSVYNYLVDQAIARLEARAREVVNLRTAGAWRERQRRVRHALREEILGPFPEKSPLRAQITGVVRKPGYRIEKVIYESVPGFHVTAALFVPEAARPPAATVVFASGHTADGFRNAGEGSGYLRIVVNLVKKGFVVFAFDPLSQGERSQYFDAGKGESRLGKASAQHGYMGMPAQLTNYSLALAMTWDGIRAIDYLETRPEVDMKRIGMCGNSGGGTQTAYVSAVDERIYASAPGNFITNYHRLLQTRGPQDPEQYLHRQIARGIDHPEYLLARAPRPTLLVTTTRDFFNIQGSRETFAEVKPAFALLGKPDNLEMVEDDAEHGYTRKNREATYAFFQKHLGVPGSPRDENVPLPTASELRVTATGHVATSLRGETFYRLSRAAAGPLVERLERSRRELPGHLERVKNSARELSGYVPPREQPIPVLAGRYQRDGYRVEKLMLEGEGKYPVPCLLMIPAGAGRHPAVVYLHPKGKIAGAAPGGEIEQLVRKGYAVLAPDLAGIGEMAPNQDAWEMAMLMGRSLVGLRAGDVVRLVRVLQARPEIDPARIGGVAHGALGVDLLHAATFESAIAHVVVVDPLVSYRALLEEEYYTADFAQGIVARALTAYDLPDLAAAIAPRPLVVIRPRNGQADPAAEPMVKRDLAIADRAYAAAGASTRFTTHLVDSDRAAGDALRKALD